jgi:hypothetical protein
MPKFTLRAQIQILLKICNNVGHCGFLFVDMKIKDMIDRDINKLLLELFDIGQWVESQLGVCIFDFLFDIYIFFFWTPTTHNEG